MRELLKKIYLKTQLGKNFITLMLKLRSAVVPEKLLLKSRFKRILGYPLNLKHPKTFNEKINWLKLNERTPLHTICSDKFAVRDHVKKQVGPEYLIPLLLETQDPNDLVPENLPDFPVIIKTNNDSGGGVNVFGKGEWQYKNIVPRIIVEKLLVNQDGEIPSDYKLHCFNGKLQFTQVDMDRHSDHKRNLYDINWNFIDCKWVYENGRSIEKPNKYEEMKAIAEKLASDFTYARVDLYLVNEHIYFGEITFPQNNIFQNS